jgi:2-dehydropantoate 2-reductase
MKIAVMGTGGVGGYFGARLAHAGADVKFVARGKHLEAIQQRGLEVKSPLGDLHLDGVDATSDPSEIGPVDLVLFGVKLWDTESAAKAIAPLITRQTAVISFQNGVVKDDILRSVAGSQSVVGGVCYIAATIAEPGVIAHSGSMQKLVFGEYNGQKTDRVLRFKECCERARIDAEISQDIGKTVWEKFVFLVGLSGSTATVRKPIGAVRSNPESRHLLKNIMEEAVRVGRAEGIRLEPDFAEDRLRFCDQLPEGMTSSMLNDLERGNPLEVQWLSGDVSRRGARLDIPTPVNTAVFDILSPHAGGRRGE